MSQEELKFSNSIPTEEDLHKMVAKLVVEKAEATERIHDLLKENTEWKLENQRLNNVLNELEKWLKKERDYYFENYYYSDFNAYGSKLNDVLDKLNELKESDK